MNSLVKLYRDAVPGDPRRDDELTQIFGQQNDIDGRYNGYQDFLSDWNRLKQPQEAPQIQWPVSYPEELTRGVGAGISSLKSTALGLGALGADVVGADSLKDALIRKYNEA